MQLSALITKLELPRTISSYFYHRELYLAKASVKYFAIYECLCEILWHIVNEE